MNLKIIPKSKIVTTLPCWGLMVHLRAANPQPRAHVGASWSVYGMSCLGVVAMEEQQVLEHRFGLSSRSQKSQGEGVPDEFILWLLAQRSPFIACVPIPSALVFLTTVLG